MLQLGHAAVADAEVPAGKDFVAVALEILLAPDQADFEPFHGPGASQTRFLRGTLHATETLRGLCLEDTGHARGCCVAPTVTVTLWIMP